MTEGTSSRTTFILLTWDAVFVDARAYGDVCNMTEKDLRFGKP